MAAGRGFLGGHSRAGCPSIDNQRAPVPRDWRGWSLPGRGSAVEGLARELPLLMVEARDQGALEGLVDGARGRFGQARGGQGEGELRRRARAIELAAGDLQGARARTEPRIRCRRVPQRPERVQRG